MVEITKRSMAVSASNGIIRDLERVIPTMESLAEYLERGTEDVEKIQGVIDNLREEQYALRTMKYRAG